MHAQNKYALNLLVFLLFCFDIPFCNLNFGFSFGQLDIG